MKNKELQKNIHEYITNNLVSFHEARIGRVKKLNLNELIKRKNPYLFRTKYETAEEIVRGLCDATISSSEETLFGNWLE